ncbi:unnamed protein product [Merluccius merluccius]
MSSVRKQLVWGIKKNLYKLSGNEVYELARDIATDGQGATDLESSDEEDCLGSIQHIAKVIEMEKQESQQGEEPPAPAVRAEVNVTTPTPPPAELWQPLVDLSHLNPEQQRLVEESAQGKLALSSLYLKVKVLMRKDKRNKVAVSMVLRNICLMIDNGHRKLMTKRERSRRHSPTLNLH